MSPFRWIKYFFPFVIKNGIIFLLCGNKMTLLITEHDIVLLKQL